MSRNKRIMSIRRAVHWCLLPLGLMLGGTALANEMRVAVLDVQRAIAESEEAQGHLDRIQQELGDAQREIRTLNNELMALQERLVRDGDVLSDMDRRNLEMQLEDKQMEYQLRVNRFQRNLNERQQDVISIMMPKVDAALQDLIAEDGYQLILHRQTILYADNAVDVTRRVTDKLNDRR